MVRTEVTTRFPGPDGVVQRHSLRDIAFDFAPPNFAVVLNRFDDFYAHVTIDPLGEVRTTRFEWGETGADTTTAFFRSVKAETERAFLIALRLNPFVHKYNHDGIYRPDSLALRITFLEAPSRAIE